MTSITIMASRNGTQGRDEVIESNNRMRLVLASAGDGVRWLSEQLAVPKTNGSTRSRLVIRAAICAAIFLLAIGVRVLHWHDHHVEVAGQNTLLTRIGHAYLRDAKQMVASGGLLVPSNREDATNARLLPHPPGYSLLMRAIFGSDLDRESYASLHYLQMFCDAIAAVLVFIITSQLLAVGVATIAGMLVAFSPHLSTYALWLTPDSLAVLPILIAIYLIVAATNRPRLILLVAAGAMVGLSCWLRANGLLLAPFLGLVILLVFGRGKRWPYSLALVAAMIVVISPIAMRNWILFHKFIPISLTSGAALVQGIGDYDTEQRFGMPLGDRETMLKDAEWFDRPDYIHDMWIPDGIERDGYRFRRGLEVIRSNPLWFGGVMLQRASLMLKYDKPHPSSRWPFNSVLVPLVAAEPPFGHNTAIDAQADPVWKKSPSELVGDGEKLSPQSEIRLAPDNSSLQITGDSSTFGDQFASALIDVEPNTDYVLILPVKLSDGPMAVKVTRVDRRFSLASSSLDEDKKSRKARQKANKREVQGSPIDPNAQMSKIKLAFASGPRLQVRWVISNDGDSATRPAVMIGQASLYKIGPTPMLWTRTVRPAVRAIQGRLFTTSRMLPLIVAGIVLLATVRRRVALLVLLAVPAYYLCVQSVFHTEYRYILAIHYLLFIMAAVAIYVGGKLIGLAAHRVPATLRHTHQNLADRPPKRSGAVDKIGASLTN